MSLAAGSAPEMASRTMSTSEFKGRMLDEGDGADEATSLRLLEPEAA